MSVNSDEMFCGYSGLVLKKIKCVKKKGIKCTVAEIEKCIKENKEESTDE